MYIYIGVWLNLHNPGDGVFLDSICMHNIDHSINISLDPRFLCLQRTREPGAHCLLVHSSKCTEHSTLQDKIRYKKTGF